MRTFCEQNFTINIAITFEPNNILQFFSEKVHISYFPAKWPLFEVVGMCYNAPTNFTFTDSSIPIHALIQLFDYSLSKLCSRQRLPKSHS